jgi:diacylglycerol kinase (ATP)
LIGFNLSIQFAEVDLIDLCLKNSGPGWTTMEKYKTTVIINPNSCNGKTGKIIEQLKASVNKIGPTELRLTEAKGHATEIVRESLKAGSNRIIAIGGDGTFNESVNGFYENGQLINSDAVFGVIPCGTGSDFIKTMEIPNNETLAVRKIINDNIKTIDLGKVTYKVKTEDRSRLFLNIAEAGIGGAVVERVNKTSKLFGGFASFLMGTLATVMDYRNIKTHVVFDDDFKIDKITNNVIVGNCRFFGGGMKILPDAMPDDGFFDVLVIGDISKLDFFKNVPKVYNGTHIHDPNFFFRRAKNVFVDSPDTPIKLDIDGEQEGTTPARFEIMPQAIKIIA